MKFLQPNPNIGEVPTLHRLYARIHELTTDMVTAQTATKEEAQDKIGDTLRQVLQDVMWTVLATEANAWEVTHVDPHTKAFTVGFSGKTCAQIVAESLAPE